MGKGATIHHGESKKGQQRLYWHGATTLYHFRVMGFDTIHVCWQNNVVHT